METKLKIEKQNKIVLYGPNGAGKSILIRAVIDQTDVVEINAKPKSAMLITESFVKQFNVKIFTPDEFSFADWNNVAVVDPTVAKRLYLEVYYDKAYDPDLGWIPLRHLSYGQRRRLAIDAALEAADLVAIENFETGLHADYIAEIIKQIAGSSATVIIETHSGAVLKLAMRYGFKAFYVEPFMRLRHIDKLDDTSIFARELSAYQAIVV